MLGRWVDALQHWFARTEGTYRSWPQRLVLTLNSILVVMALVLAGGLTYAYGEASDVDRVVVGSALRQGEEREPGVPLNFLIVGVDSAKGLAEDDQVRVGRGNEQNTDTIMILRVDPSTGRAAILSFPRDLYIEVAGRNARINTALFVGGPELLIETIWDNFQIPIDHYIEVDLAGFKSLVDEVGGVSVYFPEPVRDRNSGLYVEDAGCTLLEGDQALAYVRSRHYQRYVDGEWETDPSSDLGRVSRQQDFIRRALKKGVANGWRDPGRLKSLVDIAQENVVLDETLSAGDLLDLATDFRSFNPDELELYQVPTVGDYAGEAAILRLVKKDAQPLLDLFRGTVPVDGDDAASVIPVVEIQNGTGTAGQATQAKKDVTGIGFTVTGTAGEADNFGYEQTTVKYGPGQEWAALAMARRLPGAAPLVADESLDEGSIVLVTGADYAGVLGTPRPVSDFQAFVDEVEAAQAAAAAAAEAAAASTTTTLIGEVPPEAPDEAECR